MSWEEEVEEIKRRNELAKQMGGEANVARHHSNGRLTVRERIARLLDPNSFHETGALAGKAIYENGVLKPAQPLPLEEHETVRITIEPQRGWAERTAGMLKWTGDPKVLHRIAEDDEFGIREAR